MSRRSTGRGRRFVSASSSAVVDLSGAIGEWNFDVANVTKDGGNLIGQVNDLSGNARHLTQGTAANKPLWVDDTTDYGSLDAGGGAALKRVTKTGMGATFTHYEWTIAYISKCITAPNALNTFNIFSAQNSATGREGCGQVGYYDTTRTRRAFIITAGGSSSNITWGNAPADTWELTVVRLAGTSNGGAATATARVNGAAQSITGSTTTNNIAANGAFFLGSAISNGNCAVKYVQVWNRALDDASIASLETTLNGVYAVY